MNLLQFLLYALMALIGYRLGLFLESKGLLSSGPGAQVFSLNRIYLLAVGLLVGFLLVPRLMRWIENRFERLQAWLKKLPPEVPVAVTVASSAGLLLSVLINSLLSQFPGFSPYHSVGLALVAVGLLNLIALANRDYFRLRGVASPTRIRGGKLLDTSVLVDGRIGDVAELGFLEAPLFAPQMVLRELQMLADSSDGGRRSRGRRGLDTLERLKASCGLEVIDTPQSASDPVDEQLLALARATGAALVSNDTALLQLARIYGVKALSIQALSAALKSPYIAGEIVRITIVKEGKEPGQGIGYLEDGTMVVVDDGINFRGQEIPVIITQAIQTQVGRLLFGKPDRIPGS